ncbi:MAG: hypothetical protein ACREQA_01155 [Candidatus Binatia bacterium]
MSKTVRARIGFVSSGSRSSAHYSTFKAFIPEDIEMDFEGQNLYDKSLYEIRGKKESIVQNISDLVKNNQWDGLIVPGAPTELLNPGLLGDLQARLKIPVTTALSSCVAALRASSAKKVLLMTPFDETMNRMICDYLVKAQIEAIAPEPFRHHTDAMKLGPEEVYMLTRKTFDRAKDVEAIYFQGAVLDPLSVLERIEKELHTTVIASNPAMLWFILSKLGLSYKINGYGKLLEQWCRLPDGF